MAKGNPTRHHRDLETFSREAARRVLAEAADTPRFLDLCEAERLIWMLERAFALGANAGQRLSPRTRADGDSR